MKRTCFSILLLLMAAMMQAQRDFTVYFANNVGDVTSLRNIKAAGSGLRWTAIADGMSASNRHDVEAVKRVFDDRREKTRADQELFWKMRDDNLLCFRINDGSGRHGEFEIRVQSGETDGGLRKNVSSYFFVNTDNHNDSLLIRVNRKGCSASRQDTLHFKYYIFDWGNDDLLTFKLDSRRRQEGLTYTMECVTEDIKGTTRETTPLTLSGTHFQTFRVPEDRSLKAVYLLSNGKRHRLDEKRLMWGANLSHKLNRLWVSTNFTLDRQR